MMKIGIMNNPSNSVYDEAMLCGDMGFDFLDLTIEGPSAAQVDLARLRPILDSYGLTVTGHTDPCLPYAYPVEGIRKACFKELERCAGIFSALGAKVMNIHPCYFSPPAMRKDLLLFHIQALQSIVEMVSSHGMTVVLENYSAPFDRVSTFKTLLAEVPGLKLHLDFGHTNFGTDNYQSFCTELGEHIRHVHFSDNRSRADDHMPLGIGTVNWPDAVNALKATGYTDTITLEIFCNNADMQDRYLKLSRDWVEQLWGTSAL
jgi:sugar phosphate isomerase/epimerase